jgi:hypothetical protein
MKRLIAETAELRKRAASQPNRLKTLNQLLTKAGKGHRLDNPFAALLCVSQRHFRRPYVIEPGDADFDALTGYWAAAIDPHAHVAPRVFDAADLLRQALPYGLYVSRSHCGVKALWIYDRGYTPLLRIRIDRAAWADPFDWIEHDEARAFALGGFDRYDLRARAGILQMFVEALSKADGNMQEGWRGDFGKLICKLTNDCLSYPVGPGVRAACQKESRATRCVGARPEFFVD